jgi:hypothetical protein
MGLDAGRDKCYQGEWDYFGVDYGSKSRLRDEIQYPSLRMGWVGSGFGFGEIDFVRFSESGGLVRRGAF